MDFGKALTYQFKDAEGIKKILLISLLSLIPVAGWVIVFGWSLKISRRVIEGEPQPLPEIDLAGDLLRGLEGFLITLVYELPALLIVVPLSFGIAFSSLALKDGSAVNTFGAVTLVCVVPLAVLYSLGVTMISSAAFGNFLTHGESLGAAFRFAEVFRLVKKAPAAYFLVLVGWLISGFIAFFGLVGCIVGIIITSVYSWTVLGHLYGQAYLEAARH